MYLILYTIHLEIRNTFVTLDVIYINRSSRPEVFLGKGILKTCSKFTGEHPCWSVTSIKLQHFWNHTSTWVFSSKFSAYFFYQIFLRTSLDSCFCYSNFSEHCDMNFVQYLRHIFIHFKIQTILLCTISFK